MQNVFCVKDYCKPGLSDSEAIELCFAQAERVEGEKQVVFHGKEFFLDRAVLIDSDTTVLIDDCTIKQKDFVFDNVFRGKNVLVSAVDPYGMPVEVTPIRKVRILGKGNACVIGTDKPKTGYHPYYKEEQKMVGDFFGWRTHMFSFSNGEDLEICNLKLRQTMGWAVSFDHCRRVHVHDMDVQSNVKNGDGVNFRSGCSYCIAENITGFTSDDTVACTALAKGKSERKELSRYLSYSEPYNCSHEAIDGDVHHITIRNITTGGHHHGVICLAAEGNRVYEVDIENVVETQESDREATVKIYTGYGTGYTKGDIHDIRIRRVVSKKAKHALMIACEAESLSFEDIVQENPEGTPIYEKKP